ncbi:AAA family ATPase [Telmatobacter sp. DSM 110680]|uniref:AAA family ATPase n=1 Tax=Telmatobacter sp. DSM 110680 TaxID=3036704 RepID=A0AAU7DL50_9BACT
MDAKKGVEDWPQLERMRTRFLAICPDFIDFEQRKGFYFEQERAYKDDLIGQAQSILSGHHEEQPEKLGGQFLDLVKKSNFVGWRAFDAIAKGGADARKETAQALGEMLLSKESLPAVIETAALRIHPILRSDNNPAIGLVRSLVTSAIALAKPKDAISVKTLSMQAAIKELTGDTIIKSAVISAHEYEAILQIALRISDRMVEWNWKPRDLWDVQGFLWVATNYGKAPVLAEGGALIEDDEDDDRMTGKQFIPLNQILFGPPGTGKTWATARLAVEICNGTAPDDRKQLRKEYDELRRANRITFTTFHQSIGYEEFVEGLRPVTENEDEEDQAPAGFHLETRHGIFRNICTLAEQARKRGGKAAAFDFTKRQFFKMSLGRASTESHIYQAAIAGNYIVLGWGGDLDWSDTKYDDFQAVFDRWQEKEPGTSGNSGNIAQTWCFRSLMKKGDIVIVSNGNRRFRAVGEILGDYEFVPQGEGGNHRRVVKWLAVIKDSLPIETIYDGNLSQVTCYRLVKSRMKLEALAGLVTADAQPMSSSAEPYVLIIDEINRANISKVLGELITLIEPDKRLGGQNEITVTMPYSNDDFGVPNNLYIVGTMNTADRSIALLDTALRRRFHFTEMMPDYSCLNRQVEEIHLGKLLAAINRRVEWLFDRDHQIGHSYFTDVESKADLDHVMQAKVIPQLAEYFYEDWEKVRAALNDTNEAFIKVTKLGPPKMLQSDGEDRSHYSIHMGEIPSEGYVTASE